MFEGLPQLQAVLELVRDHKELDTISFGYDRDTYVFPL